MVLEKRQALFLALVVECFAVFLSDAWDAQV